jgi:hypothetical protein
MLIIMDCGHDGEWKGRGVWMGGDYSWTQIRVVSILQKLVLDLLALEGFLLEDVEVVAPHAVHDEEGDAHVPGHEHHAVHPDLGPHSARLHLGFVVLCESLAGEELLDGGHGATRGEVALLDGLALEVFLLVLLLGGEEEGGVEAVEDAPHRLAQLLHQTITININIARGKEEGEGGWVGIEGVWFVIEGA